MGQLGEMIEEQRSGGKKSYAYILTQAKRDQEKDQEVEQRGLWKHLKRPGGVKE